jgi:K+-transporting ATPase ATPase C chain
MRNRTLQHLKVNFWLLAASLLLCAVVYPLAVFGVAQAFFHDKAQGSLIHDASHKLVGSRLIAQPFTGDEYFQPRPSAVSYNASASGASNWAASNYLLRDRVARALGPIVKYRNGPKNGQRAAPDIETWFQKDHFQGKPGIVAQWAQAHPTVAQNWVKADKANAQFVEAWRQAHAADVALWIKQNPDTPEPKPEDLAVPFFTNYSATHPGTFPGMVEHKDASGQAMKTPEPVKEGTDIQSTFFDMWRQEHADAELENVPADMVMASGSGLDPHITLKNALYQLDRVAKALAAKTARDENALRTEVEKWLRENAESPLGGLVGEPLVNVLEVNLLVSDRFQPGKGVR